MDWSNDRILEFIAKYESEPVLWNPHDPNYKKKHLKYDAWLRIKDNMSWPITVDDLKNKMKSLMAYYRAHQNKYKRSLKSEAGKDDVYQTNWFAFSAMNSFLAPLYECQQSDMQMNDEYDIQNGGENSEAGDIIEMGHYFGERAKSIGKKRRSNDLPLEIIDTSQHTQETPQQTESSSNDEYEIFGKLIAIKIRKLCHNTREIVMNDIYNLIFRAGMVDRLGQSNLSRQTFQTQNNEIFHPASNRSTTHSLHHQTSPNHSTS